MTQTRAIECTHSDFLYNIKLGGSADVLEGRKALQKNLDRLDLSSESNCVRFNQEKCQFCTWLHNSPTQGYRLGPEWLEGCLLGKHTEGEG